MKQIHRKPMAGKTVLVTGASGGIGKATAVGLATMGARLAVMNRATGDHEPRHQGRQDVTS